MKRRDHFKIRFAIAVLSNILILISFVGLMSRMTTDYDAEAVSMDTGWAVSVNGETTYENVTLSEFTFDQVLNTGDVVTLKNTLPTNADNDMTMRFLIYLATVDVKVGGKEIYSYGHEIADAGKMVGSGYHFITLPDECGGQQVIITLQVTERAAFTNIPVPELVPTSVASYKFANDNMASIYASMFLLIFGIVVTCLAALACCFSKEYVQLIYIGLFSLTIGVWSMCNTKILEIFSMNLRFNTTMEYISLYLAPLPLLAIVIRMQQGSDVPKKRRMPLHILGVVDIAFVAVTTLLHVTDIKHYPESVSLFHVFAIVAVLVGIYACFGKQEKRDASDKIFLASLVEIFIFGAADIFRFNLQKYILPDSVVLSNSMLPIGTLIFVILLMVSYLVHMYTLMMAKVEKDALTNLAYTDHLTGCGNRARAEQIFVELDKGHGDYSMINLDLNGLKKTNDSMGHAMGDELLVNFAAVLREAFGEKGTVLRMGGDEFLVIVEGHYRKDIDLMLNKMRTLSACRSLGKPYEIDASYGVANLDMTPSKSAESVYSKADELMYRMKLESKKART